RALLHDEGSGDRHRDGLGHRPTHRLEARRGHPVRVPAGRHPLPGTVATVGRLIRRRWTRTSAREPTSKRQGGRVMAFTQSTTETWPPLPYDAWKDTLDTLHMWTQVVGKVKLELVPFLNEWWEVAFTVTARGLTTGTIPFGRRVFQVDFDFLDHRLDIRASDGASRSLSLGPRSVANFYRAFMAALAELGIGVQITTFPVEVENTTPFDQDEVHASYDPDPV